MAKDTHDRRSTIGCAGGIVRLGYQQIASVLAAFTMALLVGELFNLGWRGIIRKIVGIWSDVVRPVTKWVADVIVFPLEFITGWNVEIPIWVRDYFAVGLIFVLSILRVEALDARGRRPTIPRDRDDWKMLLTLGLMWPFWIMIFGMSVPIDLSLLATKDADGVDLFPLLAVLPVVYLGLLVAVNYLFL